MARPVSAFSNSARPISASEAGLSADGRHRWWLTRRWGDGGRSLLFIGLNPSRADGSRDDPTLRRLIGFGRDWGYDALVVVNLFARMSPSPAALRRSRDPIGSRCDAELLHWTRQWAVTADWDLWCGWGNGGRRAQRDVQVAALLRPLVAERELRVPHRAGPLALGLTGARQPRHPLYAPRTLQLQPFSWAGIEVIRHPEKTLTAARPR